MDVRTVNPWTWQDHLQLAFSQAVDVTGAQRVLYCAGQTSVDAGGRPLHAGNMEAQIEQALDNVEAVLAHANLTLANVVRLNYYTTNVDGFMQASAKIGARLHAAGRIPAGTLVGVARLFHPEILVEIEATAVA
jgi:enamine deaminase RidA (YjgF/YER057c/UK114 family)